MFPNLEAEMARHHLTRGALADALHKTPTTISLKLRGDAPLTLMECIEIRDLINPELTIEYLFASEIQEATT